MAVSVNERRRVRFALRAALAVLVAGSVFGWTHTRFQAARNARIETEALAGQWDDFVAWTQHLDLGPDLGHGTLGPIPGTWWDQDPAWAQGLG